MLVFCVGLHLPLVLDCISSEYSHFIYSFLVCSYNNNFVSCQISAELRTLANLLLLIFLFRYTEEYYTVLFWSTINGCKCNQSAAVMLYCARSW